MDHRRMPAPLRGALTLTLAALLATAVAGAPAFAAPPAEDGARAAASTTVDLNRATVEQLEAVRGIGPALAKRIVEFREEHGPFERVEDLLKVRGIGEKSLEKLRPYVRVEPRR